MIDFDIRLLYYARTGGFLDEHTDSIEDILLLDAPSFTIYADSNIPAHQ